MERNPNKYLEEKKEGGVPFPVSVLFCHFFSLKTIFLLLSAKNKIRET
jgi:hypothetical protein